MPDGKAVPGQGAINPENLSLLSVLDGISEGAYITDTDRRILFWNKRAEEITGWTAEQVVGKHCRDNILCHTDPQGRPLCGDELCPLKRAMVTGQSSRSPLNINARSADGKTVCISVTVSPIYDGEGNVIGGIEFFRDETDGIRQHNFAASIQRSLINFHEIDDERIELGYISEPAEDVNGDYCNVFRLNKDIYGLVVCDVMGHGIGSALVSTMIHSFFVENMGLWVEPSSMLANLNERICSISGQPMSVTATLVMANLESRELIASHAGAPPAVLIRNGETAFVGDAGGLPCGMFDGQLYDEESFEMEPGDGIFLYSDGALEVKTDYGELLGYDGLMEFLKEISLGKTGEGIGEIKAKIVRSSREIRLQDDFTIVHAKIL